MNHKNGRAILNIKKNYYSQPLWSSWTAPSVSQRAMASSADLNLVEMKAKQELEAVKAQIKKLAEFEPTEDKYKKQTADLMVQLNEAKQKILRRMAYRSKLT